MADDRHEETTDGDTSATLVIGGARSGKSRYAQRRALSLGAEPVYLATSRVWDEDHRARIERHRRDRGPEWTTIEEPLRLSRVPVSGRIVVVDCITLWLTNVFAEQGYDPELALSQATAELTETLKLPATWIFVSNEVGQGVHPPTEIGRKFADLQGLTNQFLAERCRRVVLMVAGVPLEVKNRGLHP